MPLGDDSLLPTSVGFTGCHPQSQPQTHHSGHLGLGEFPKQNFKFQNFKFQNFQTGITMSATPLHGPMRAEARHWFPEVQAGYLSGSPEAQAGGEV